MTGTPDVRFLFFLSNVQRAVLVLRFFFWVERGDTAPAARC